MCGGVLVIGIVSLMTVIRVGKGAGWAVGCELDDPALGISRGGMT